MTSSYAGRSAYGPPGPKPVRDPYTIPGLTAETSAPRPPRTWRQYGPASATVRSRTVTPTRGPDRGLLSGSSASASATGRAAQELDGPLPHLDLADLAGDGHGELVGEMEIVGDLVVRQLTRAILPKGLKRERGRIGPEPHPRH